LISSLATRPRPFLTIINKEQVMRKYHLKHMVAVFAVILAHGATADETTFMKLDRNADGFISAEESIIYEALYEGWSAADANNDGRIDTSEFSAFEINSASEQQRESSQ
jgi:Ca2+-binding EF-hand superfamily protein